MPVGRPVLGWGTVHTWYKTHERSNYMVINTGRQLRLIFLEHDTIVRRELTNSLPRETGN